MNILNRVSTYLSSKLNTNALILKSDADADVKKIVDETVKNIIESDIKIWDGVDDLTIPRLVSYDNDYVFGQFKDDKYLVVHRDCHISYVNKDKLFAPAFIKLAEQLLPIYKNNLLANFKKAFKQNQ